MPKIIMTLTEEQKKKIVELFTEQNFGADTIARMIGVKSYSPVKRFLDSQGLKRDHKFYHEHGNGCHAVYRYIPLYDELDKKRVEALFKQGKTLAVISKELQMSIYRVNACCKEMGLKRTKEELRAMSKSNGSGVSVYASSTNN